MMQCSHALLYIHTGTHFASRAHHDADFTLVDFLIECQPLFLVFSIVNESNFILRYAASRLAAP